jgi:hypothetical protein
MECVYILAVNNYKVSKMVFRTKREYKEAAVALVAQEDRTNPDRLMHSMSRQG